jgi:hypothetical protein
VGCGVRVLVGLGALVRVGDGVGEGSMLCGDSDSETVETGVRCVHPMRIIVMTIPNKIRD